MNDRELDESREDAAKAGRTWQLIVVGIVLLTLAIVATAGIEVNTRSRIDKEVEQRITTNRNAIILGCRSVDDLAIAVKALVASSGSTTPASALDGVTFQDPAVAVFVRGILERSAMNAARLRAQGDKIKVLDCMKLVNSAPGDPPPTVPASTTTTGG